MFGSPKGCQIVAGGRSVAKTAANIQLENAHPEGVQDLWSAFPSHIEFHHQGDFVAQISHRFGVRFVSR
jgi:hypothetical protein